MTKPVKLELIIEGMEMQFEDSRTFLNKITGEIISVTSEDLRAAEDDEPFEHLPEWQQEEREVALDVIDNFENYVELPTNYDINEYEIMEDFCLDVRERGRRDTLLGVIKGRGAFRRFKDRIIEFGIETEWYSFRDKRFKEIAIEWCQDNKIMFVE
ncbi:UPF0158 family protein [Neobacillus drentensis]|uniref:UPF0158 family protein n=1 Tax=Neobacillus drentensis TaxID=220684 RepID=UPI002FFDFD9D